MSPRPGPEWLPGLRHHWRTHQTMVGQLELKDCCKINPLIRAINAILIMSFPILTTILAGCWLVQPQRHSSQAKIRNYKQGRDFKNTLLPISFQSSILNTRYKKPLCSLLFCDVFLLLAKPLSLRFSYFILAFSFLGWFGFFFGNQNGNSLLYALRFPARKKKKRLCYYSCL